MGPWEWRIYITAEARSQVYTMHGGVSAERPQPRNFSPTNGMSVGRMVVLSGELKSLPPPTSLESSA